MSAIFPQLLATLLLAGQAFQGFAQAPRPACGNNSKFGVSKFCVGCPCPGLNAFEPYTGNVQREITDLELWGSVGELPMVWQHYYTSRGNILWNYSFVYAMYDGPITGGQPTVVVDYPEGGQNTFTRNPANSSEWLPPPGIDKKVFQYGNDFIMQMANGFRYRFTKFSLVIGPNTYFYYLLQDIRDSKQNRYRLTYTVNRQLDSVIEPAGRFFKVHYTIVGGRRLIGQVSTGDGRLVRYEYDIYNDGVSKWIRFTGVKYGDSTQAKYTYIQSSPGVSLRLGSANDPRYPGDAVKMSYTYNWALAPGYIREEKNDVTGGVMATLYATDSTRVVCYANGKQEIFRMPPALLGNRQSYTDGLGRTSRYGYDMGGLGFLTKDTDALNRVTSYDARTVYGNPLHVTYPDNSTEVITRDSLGLALTYTDGLGRVTAYTRDANHRVTRIDYPDSSFETFSYNSFAQVLAHTQRNGGVTHNAYDSRGLMTSYTDAAGHTTTLSYDGADRLDSMTDARGNVTSYQYDERGLLTKLVHPDLSFRSYVYDTFGNNLSRTNELGHTWAAAYDEFRRPISLTDPLSRITQYAYDLPGSICGCAHGKAKPTSTTLPSGRITRFEYDVEWQKIAETEGASTADAATTSYEYDMMGNLVETVDPRGKIWQTEYDDMDRVKATIDPLGHRTEWSYDSVGNTLTVKRPDAGVTLYAYDAMNRLTLVTDPQSQVTRYTYDAAGNTDSLIDPRGNVYRFEYDLLDRGSRVIYPDASFERYTYDAVSNLDSFVSRAGTVRTYTYDSRNRETLSDWSDATPDVSRSYDAGNRLLGISSSVSTMTYAYNVANELTSEAQSISGSGGGSKTVSYTYNADGLNSTMTYPGGTMLGYSYTSRNQLDSIIDGIGPALVNYAYDADGNRIAKALRNGTVTSYTYDDDGRMLTIDHKLGSSSFSRFDYGYDNVHRRTFMQRDLGKGDVYSYDAIDQVTDVLYDAGSPATTPSAPARTVNYGLDASGNRTAVTDNSIPTAYSSNSLNQYTSVDGNVLTYTGNGDLATYTGWTYSYDAQSRLTSASNGSTSVSFAYDGQNRCVRRIANGAARYFYYNGWNLIEERDAADVLQQHYAHGAMTDELLTKTAAGSTLYYHHDALGDVIRLTGAAGAVLEQYTYDVFGAPAVRDGSGSPIAVSAMGNRFLFTGREYIAETGLYDYRNRYYSAELGRFLQDDPIGFGGGDYNLYRYAGNNVINQTDAYGLLDPKGEKIPFTDIYIYTPENYQQALEALSEAIQKEKKVPKEKADKMADALLREMSRNEGRKLHNMVEAAQKCEAENDAPGLEKKLQEMRTLLEEIQKRVDKKNPPPPPPPAAVDPEALRRFLEQLKAPPKKLAPGLEEFNNLLKEKDEEERRQRERLRLIYNPRSCLEGCHPGTKTRPRP